MALQKNPTNQFIISCGLILGFIYVFIKVVLQLTDLSSEIGSWGTNLFYLIFLATIFYAVNQFKKRNGNLLKVSEAIKTGLTVAVISGLIIGIYILIYRYIISPESIDLLIEETRLKYANNPNMSEEMLDKMMIGVRLGVQPWFTAVFWVFTSALFGLIYSFIAGLIMKKETTEPQLF